MTNAIALNEMITTNGGTVSASAEDNSEFKFWDAVKWVNHEQYGTGRVFNPDGENQTVGVIFWTQEGYIPSIDLYKV